MAMRPRRPWRCDRCDATEETAEGLEPKFSTQPTRIRRSRTKDIIGDDKCTSTESRSLLDCFLETCNPCFAMKSPSRTRPKKAGARTHRGRIHQKRNTTDIDTDDEDPKTGGGERGGGRASMRRSVWRSQNAPLPARGNLFDLAPTERFRARQ